MARHTRTIPRHGRREPARQGGLSLRPLVVGVAILLVAGLGYLVLGGLVSRTEQSTATDKQGVLAGSQLYNRYCTSCHGYSVNSSVATTEVAQIIGDGRPQSGMPAFISVLEVGEIEALAEFVVASKGLSSDYLAGSGGLNSTLYLNNCAACHGANGDQVAKANLSSSAFWSSRDDAEVTGIVARGKGGMPAFGKTNGGILGGQEIGELVALVRRWGERTQPPLSPPTGAQSEGASLYANACAACHGPGGNLLAKVNLMSPSYWQNRDDASVIRAISQGKGGMPPLSQAKGGMWTVEQLQSIPDYLRQMAKSERPPDPSARLAEAKELYGRTCSACHGAKGDGVPGIKFSSRESMSSRSDDALAGVVANGRAGMPAYGRSSGGALEADQIQWMVKYLRSITGGPSAATTPAPARSTASPTPAADTEPVKLDVDASGHQAGWAGKHSRFVREDGARSCYKCHQNTYCVGCHLGGGR